MNNLVLLRVVAALDAAFSGGVLRDVRQDDPHRYRLLFDHPDRGGSVLISLRPEQPWLGRPRGRWPGKGRAKHAFAGACSRVLTSAVLSGIDKDPADRVVAFRFADGHKLVAELAVHGANLVLVDGAGNVEAAARSPKRSRERLAIGEAYVAPPFPARLLDPFAADAAAIQQCIDEGLRAGEELTDVLRRRIFGLGVECIELLLREDAADSQPGHVAQRLARRLTELTAGQADPVVQADGDPSALADQGALVRSRVQLLPWRPTTEAPAGASYFQSDDAAGTAGLYHDALERMALVEGRWTGLRAVVKRELGRLSKAEMQARGDLAGFSDPERYKRYGEALLAGLHGARVDDGVALVPDPYATDAGATLAVPIPPGETLPAAAQHYFDRHRRALRGADRTRQRIEELERRCRELSEILERYDGATAVEPLQALEEELRAARLPVALEPETHSGRALQRVTQPRLEGVRVFTGKNGATILAGKGGRENDRLTFRLAAPEDLWFHALGHPGAHVIVRDPGKRPPQSLIEEAAGIAAWYSDAKSDGRVDVQWTRRKFVRRKRGAPPGTVLIKKFETVRVKPGLPRGHGI